mgnify:CR=1 FL=1
MRFVIGADHGGYELKEQLIRYLKDMEHEILDVGTDSPASVDYPDICIKACDVFISHGSFDFVILICGTGIGMSMCANRYHGVIRCAVCNDETSALMSRKHNNANVIALGARIIDYKTAKTNLDIFINTEFERGRHLRRLNKLPIIT